MLSLADVLDLPVVRRALPEVVIGEHREVERSSGEERREAAVAPSRTAATGRTSRTR